MNLSKLYTIYNTLSDAKDKVSEHIKEYNDAIEATKGGVKEKQLAAQIISKYFKHFPDLQGFAMNAVFDLCEDADLSIRIAAMKTFPSFYKDNIKNLPKVADILAQLLQLDDPQDYNVASSMLIDVLKEDATFVVKNLFKHITDKANETDHKKKLIKFVTTKVKALGAPTITHEVELLIFNEAKAALVTSAPEEFILLMEYLSTCKQSQTLSNQEELVNIITDKLDMDSEFVPIDDKSNNVDKLITCVKFIIPFFSSKLESTEYCKYYCDQVLTRWEALEDLPGGSSQYKLGLAQQLAELSQHCGQLNNPTTQIEQIFEILKLYMPPPPEDTNPLTGTMPEFNFSMVECLLYAFHRLARQKPEFLTDNEETLKDFRARLMYFSRGVQGCLKVLNMSDKEKIFSPEEKKVREMSPKLLNNINTLVKDLFYKPPIYKCAVTLSFKKDMIKVTTKSTPDSSSVAGSKRHQPITYESNGASKNKQGRLNRSGMMGEKKIYTPPSGKFSHNFHNNDRNSRFRGGRGGGGPIRGQRNRGRGNYRN